MLYIRVKVVVEALFSLLLYAVRYTYYAVCYIINIFIDRSVGRLAENREGVFYNVYFGCQKLSDFPKITNHLPGITLSLPSV